jgi:hypothetical protein
MTSDVEVEWSTISAHKILDLVNFVNQTIQNIPFLGAKLILCKALQLNILHQYRQEILFRFQILKSVIDASSNAAHVLSNQSDSFMNNNIILANVRKIKAADVSLIKARNDSLATCSALLANSSKDVHFLTTQLFMENTCLEDTSNHATFNDSRAFIRSMSHSPNHSNQIFSALPYEDLAKSNSIISFIWEYLNSLFSSLLHCESVIKEWELMPMYAELSAFVALCNKARLSSAEARNDEHVESFLPEITTSSILFHQLGASTELNTSNFSIFSKILTQFRSLKRLIFCTAVQDIVSAFEALCEAYVKSLHKMSVDATTTDSTSSSLSIQHDATFDRVNNVCVTQTGCDVQNLSQRCNILNSMQPRHSQLASLQRISQTDFANISEEFVNAISFACFHVQTACRYLLPSVFRSMCQQIAVGIDEFLFNKVMSIVSFTHSTFHTFHSDFLAFVNIFLTCAQVSATTYELQLFFPLCCDGLQFMQASEHTFMKCKTAIEAGNEQLLQSHLKHLKLNTINYIQVKHLLKHTMNSMMNCSINV